MSLNPSLSTIFQFQRLFSFWGERGVGSGGRSLPSGFQMLIPPPPPYREPELAQATPCTLHGSRVVGEQGLTRALQPFLKASAWGGGGGGLGSGPTPRAPPVPVSSQSSQTALVRARGDSKSTGQLLTSWPCFSLISWLMTHVMQCSVPCLLSALLSSFPLSFCRMQTPPHSALGRHLPHLHFLPISSDLAGSPCLTGQPGPLAALTTQ